MFAHQFIRMQAKRHGDRGIRIDNLAITVLRIDNQCRRRDRVEGLP